MTFPAPTQLSEALITANLGLARQQAWKFCRRTGQPYDDLEAIAYVGLIRGCRRYDPERLNPGTGKPYALSTIVTPFIAGEILHWFRDKGFGMKFPTKWREQWGKVQRLMADPGLSAQDVAEQCGLSIADLTEMLAAMTTVGNLDDIHGADACDPPEPVIPRVNPLMQLVEHAWKNLHPGDQMTFLRWWAAPRRLAMPLLPLQQLHRRINLQLRGQRLSEFVQQALAMDVEPISAADRRAQREQLEREYGLESEPRRPRGRSRKALDTAAAQLGLLQICK